MSVLLKLYGGLIPLSSSHPRAQVCCVPAASLSSYLSQRTLLQHSAPRQPGPVPGARCGRQLTAAKRVVGGTEAGFGSFPWMALVRAGQARCGGALVGDRWVGFKASGQRNFHIIPSGPLFGPFC